VCEFVAPRVRLTGSAVLYARGVINI
jgi:hypothetical protein